QVHPRKIAHGGGLQGIVNLVAAQRLEPHDYVFALLRDVQTEFYVAVDLDVTGADVRKILNTNGHHRRVRAGPKLRTPLVVGIQHREAVAVARQNLEQRSLLFRHSGFIPEELDMSESDIGDHADIGPHHPGQDRNFARMIGAEFEHAEVMGWIKSQKIERHTNVVVIIPGRFHYIESLAE